LAALSHTRASGHIDRTLVDLSHASPESLNFQEQAMARLETFPEGCAAIKRSLDPKGILSPGRYGMG